MALLGVFSLITGAIYFKLKNLDYNSEGRFFDTNESVVYLEQSVLLFAILTLIGSSLFIIISLIYIRAYFKRAS